MSQQRPRQVQLASNASKFLYDPTATLLDRLYPQLPKDPKLDFIKVRERALRRTFYRKREETRVKMPKPLKERLKTEKSRFETLAEEKR